jgi:four helix bundle protein
MEGCMEQGVYSLDKFELYKLARKFRKNIYSLVKKLPVEEKYCLAPQMRKAALSVSNNIAEGHGRWHYKENIQFCRISRISIEEVIDDLNTCEDENYFDLEIIKTHKAEAYFLIKKINGYIAYLKKTKQTDL